MNGNRNIKLKANKKQTICKYHKLLLTIATAFLLPLALIGQSIDRRAVGNFFKAPGSPVNPIVEILWNRYHTNEGLLGIYRQMEQAFPNLLTMQSIGKSSEGRDLWLLIISPKAGKPHREKPGFWIDGNIHANEIQSAEVALYTAWYLLETYEKNDFITQLVNENAFYILPVMNPDGREHFMNKPNTTNSPRAGTIPLDDDGDGLAGEDGFDDLNNDGHITQMRRRNPMGQWREDPNDTRRMMPARAEEFGQWEILGFEGLDRDGDGTMNEDPSAGFYDPNRDWGWNWQPDYVQGGAYRYPFSLPETRAVRNFAIAHSNIAGVLTHHNTGGMFLRGPGVETNSR